MSPPSPEKQSENIDLKTLSKALKQFLEVAKFELDQQERALLLRLSLLAELKGGQEKVRQFFSNGQEKIKKVLLETINRQKLSPELARELLKIFAENQVMSELYGQFGKEYKLGSKTQETTDCVQILQQSKTFHNLADQNPVRFFSEGSDLVLDEKLGRVADIVDRDHFDKLTQYKPTKDKMYVFGLVKPPIFFNGKPNVTHLQIPTSLNQDPKKLAVIHASSDKKQVVIENDLQGYLAASKFQRVYVVEIDLKHPYANSKTERQPQIEAKGYRQETYKRPRLYDIPLQADGMKLIEPKDQEIVIAEEEKRTLELMADNRALGYLTVITGIREGKIGQKQNMAEAAAFKIFYNPEKHTVGLHQVSKIVAGPFDRWIGGIDEEKAQALGTEVHELWIKKHSGKTVEWTDIVPYLNTYDLSEKRYKNVTISTICAYLLLKNLSDNELMGAYQQYGEPFFGLEENPEAVIAISAAYRRGMGVMVRGGQQYRLAEIANKLGFLDQNFQFTDAAKNSPEYKDYEKTIDGKFGPGWKDFMTSPVDAFSKNDGDKAKLYKGKFLVDGYKGLQMQHLAYMCYKKLHPDGVISFQDFDKAYNSTQTNLLSSTPAKTIREDYQKLFGFPPKLLMAEEELRGLVPRGGTKTNTPLQAKTITFANEGLWAIAHLRKLTEENWDKVKSPAAANGYNPTLENVLDERSLRTNEVSKIPAEQGQSFNSLIASLPGDAWYKKYPDLIMAACFTKGLFLKERQRKQDGKWIHETKEFIKTLFETNLPQIEKGIPQTLVKDEKNRAELAIASAALSVDEIIYLVRDGIEPSKLLANSSDKNALRLRTYSKSFAIHSERFALKDPSILEKKETLTPKEKQEKFVLQVFRVVRQTASAHGLNLDFAMAATAIASLECGWGQEKNALNEPTLYVGANNIFSIKYDYKQYSEEQYHSQDPNAPFYVHHTKEYLDTTHPEKATEHYEAFRKYKDIDGSIQDFVRLIGKKYKLTTELAKQNPKNETPDTETQERILSALISEKYATDPSYVEKALTIAKSTTKILRQYGQII